MAAPPPAPGELAQALQRAASDLKSIGRDVALVGGLAVGVRAQPRFTRDIDLAVRVADDRDAESVVFELGYPVRASVEHVDRGRLATVRLTAPIASGDPPFVVLLFASSGIEPEIVGAAETLELPGGVLLPVATRAHLIAVKTLAERRGREQDRVDLIGLIRAASPGELADARAALDLIRARGYDRGKDLHARLDRFLAAAADRDAMDLE